MRKLVFISLTAILFLSTLYIESVVCSLSEHHLRWPPFLTVHAVDLPIDIGIIGQQQDAGDAITVRFGIDLFTQRSRAITEQIVEDYQKESERLTQDLFVTTSEIRPDMRNQIAAEADAFNMFAVPINYSATATVTNDTQIQTWMMILLFGICAVAGFVLAQVSKAHRKGREKNVH